MLTQEWLVCGAQGRVVNRPSTSYPATLNFPLQVNYVSKFFTRVFSAPLAVLKFYLLETEKQLEIRYFLFVLHEDP